MSKGTLSIHVLNHYSMPLTGGIVAAKKGSVIQQCTAAAGVCSLSLQYGTWRIVAKSQDGCWISDPVDKVINGAHQSLVLPCKNETPCSSSSAGRSGCPPCPPCPPCSSAQKATSLGALASLAGDQGEEDPKPSRRTAWWVFGGSVALGVIGFALGARSRDTGAPAGALTGAVVGAAVGYGASVLLAPSYKIPEGMGVALPIRRRIV